MIAGCKLWSGFECGIFINDFDFKIQSHMANLVQLAMVLLLFVLLLFAYINLQFFHNELSLSWFLKVDGG